MIICPEAYFIECNVFFWNSVGKSENRIQADGFPPLRGGLDKYSERRKPSENRKKKKNKITFSFHLIYFVRLFFQLWRK
jgi:hypothetical protein